MALQNPQELFLYNLGAMYDIEQNLAQVLPVLARECQNPQVKQAFQEHEQQTRQHVRNLEQCFQILGHQPISLNNHTVAGLKQDHDAFVQQQPAIRLKRQEIWGCTSASRCLNRTCNRTRMPQRSWEHSSTSSASSHNRRNGALAS